VSKYLWGSELILSARGVGWNWEVEGIPPAPRLSLWGFIKERAQNTILTFGLIYGVSVLACIILDDDSAIPPNVNTPWLRAILDHPVFLHVFLTVAWLTVIYGHVTLPENLCAMVLVGSGRAGRWSDPEQWPAFFGDISESYTLRRCWG
jgi:hypothetical protein